MNYIRNRRFSIGDFFIVLGLAGMICFGLYLDSDQVKGQVSLEPRNDIPIGYLNTKDVKMEHDIPISPKNYTVKLNIKDEKVNLIIWDFMVEDRDIVQIYVDGQPYSEKFTLRAKPTKIPVPVNKNIEIKGVKDSDGYRIGYAVNFSEKTTYFNSVKVGESNKYKLEN